MKKVLVSLMSLGLLCTTLVVAGDLVDKKENNGSFEDGISGWMVHAFGNYEVASEVVEKSKTDPAPDGKAYLKVTASSASEGSLAIRATLRLQEESFKKNQKVHVSAKVRTTSLDEFSSAYYVIVFYDKDNESKPLVMQSEVLKLKNTEWTELTHEFMVKDDITAQPFDIRLCMRTGGDIKPFTEAVGYMDALTVSIEK